MPTKPKVPCRHPGCPNLVEPGEKYCSKHLIQVQQNLRKPFGCIDERRPNSTERGYGHKWRQAREGYLKKHPTCVKCGAPATVVDHIKPHKGDKQLFWDRDNWQALCKRCHDLKTFSRDVKHKGGRGQISTAFR